MPTITDTEFQAAVKGYLRNEHFSIAELSRKVGKGKSTVGDWIRTGIKRDEVRQKIVDQYPWLFNSNESESGLEAVSVPVTGADIARQSLLVLLKTEQARSVILQLRSILAWFLFQASSDDRNQFRDMLGDEWKQFLKLTIAMTNEKAFDLAQKEGELKWNKRK